MSLSLIAFFVLIGAFALGSFTRINAGLVALVAAFGVGVLIVGMPVKDATGGYRAYRMPVLDKIEVDTVLSQGYCFQTELAWRAHRSGCKVVEVPITFAERERGVSKLSSNVARETLMRVTGWGWQTRTEPIRRRFGKRRT